MPRVLILGLYYPPANFMAGWRLEGWVRHLREFGYEPQVLTRFYDPAERDSHDFYASSRPTRTLEQPWIQSNGAVYTRFAESTWHKLPIPGFIRGVAHYAWPDPDHSHWIRECLEYLNATDYKPDVIIGSYGPAGIFSVAQRLSDRFNVPWIADYGDIWIELFDHGASTRFKYWLQKRHLESAAGLVAASEGVEEALRRQLAPLEKPLRLVYNGAEPFDDVPPDDVDRETVEAFHRISAGYAKVLTYTGTIYPAQQIDLFLNTVEQYNQGNNQPIAIVLCGRHAAEKYARWPFVHLLGPVGRPTARYFQRASTAGFYPTWWPQKHTGLTGKIFEMIVSGRPTLVFAAPPPDLENLCRRFTSVTIAKDAESLLDALHRLPLERSATNQDESRIATTKHTVGELASLLDEVLDRRND